MSRTFKRQLYEQFARVGHALASPARIELVDLLSQGEKSVEHLAAEAGLGIKNASAHLRILREARLVETRKDSRFVYYRIAGPEVFQVLRGLQSLAHERLAEVDAVAHRYLGALDEMEPATVDELERRIREGSAAVLDVRPADEYESGHIPGSISIPIDELESRLGDLPEDTEIIAYCRGRYCVYAVEAVNLLRRHGFRARRLDVGLPDWRYSGRPVVAGALN